MKTFHFMPIEPDTAGEAGRDDPVAAQMNEIEDEMDAIYDKKKEIDRSFIAAMEILESKNNGKHPRSESSYDEDLVAHFKKHRFIPKSSVPEEVVSRSVSSVFRSSASTLPAPTPFSPTSANETPFHNLFSPVQFVDHLEEMKQ
ncbi:MAG: hypothetical protein K1X28_02375 [Parachlamydiales bacterium]|nr:hypothetical protein [Parachlamydiales bacterium]